MIVSALVIRVLVGAGLIGGTVAVAAKPCADAVSAASEAAARAVSEGIESVKPAHLRIPAQNHIKIG